MVELSNLEHGMYICTEHMNSYEYQLLVLWMPTVLASTRKGKLLAQPANL